MKQERCVTNAYLWLLTALENLIAEVLRCPSTVLEYIQTGGMEEDLPNLSWLGLAESLTKQREISSNLNYWVPQMTRMRLGQVPFLGNI